MSGTHRVGEEVLWWAALNHVPGAGAATMQRLVRVFGSPRAAAHASAEELVSRGRLTSEQARALVALTSSPEELHERLQRYTQHGISVVSMDDPAYPRPLLDLANPPPLLYAQGSLLSTDIRAVAVVGTRAPQGRGTKLAESLAHAFASRGFAIVSGLARGIDTAAHRGALEVEQGRTIACLGCGLLRLYPPENVGLAARIARRGALVSEVPPETQVSRGLLLARDRLQAAMSRAVIVVQAPGRCGSLVTARHALQCGRLVFGVPWDKPPFSEGWEELQKLGARPITVDADPDQLLLGIEETPPSQPPLL